METHELQDLWLPFEEASDTRRGFLRLVGFGVAGATLASCSRAPVRPVVPALATGEGVIAGRAYRVATTCGGCSAGCGALAKCLDGRPLKLEGSPGHPVSGGGLCAVGQASVLALYDSKRLGRPLRAGEPLSFDEADRELGARFEALRREGGRVRLLTGTIHSPSTREWIERFLAGFADARHVVYDGLSASALLEAHELLFGLRVLPRPRLERARTIVSFDADFLGTWISPVEFGAGWARGRAVDASPERFSRHVQLEARFSLTGSVADERIALAPWERAVVLRSLCAELERLAGVPARIARTPGSGASSLLGARLARELWSTRGESLVVVGADLLQVQLLCAYANHLLESYEATLELAPGSLQRVGDERELGRLAAELEEGAVEALIVQGVNPAHELGGKLALERAKLLVRCASGLDESALLAHWVCPEPHFLEGWDDGEPRAGLFVLTQPASPPLFEARSLRCWLARWCGDARGERELVAAHWRERIFPRQERSADFDAFFDGALHQGWVELQGAARERPRLREEALGRLGQLGPEDALAEPAPGELGLVLHAQVAMPDGRHAHNPWLQELPDPISKVAWDNYAALAPRTAAELGLAEGDVVRVEGAGRAAEDPALELPVLVQPGQAERVVALALGYGRCGTDRFAKLGPAWIGARPTVAEGGTVGVNVAPLQELGARGRRGEGLAVRLVAAGRRVRLARTQLHHELEVPAHLAVEGHERRDAVLSVGLAEHLRDPAALRRAHPPQRSELWPDDHPLERRWGMAIDLARCTGCSACVVACQAENNVPVVGKDEVLRQREMSWLRIDRYYAEVGGALRAFHQPMLCQHCDHAPCESVCPVLATVHSAEGLNQQVYNRCVGTRYCANTCPYKVRRFNWFDYPREDELANAALNPEVTVRSRGVMEKCSFCAQRIQEAKSAARREGRALADGDVRTACQDSCPASAIAFGDLLDPASGVARLAESPRAYGLLDEVGLRPSIVYLAHVAKASEAEDGRAG